MATNLTDKNSTLPKEESKRGVKIFALVVCAVIVIFGIFAYAQVQSDNTDDTTRAALYAQANSLSAEEFWNDVMNEESRQFFCEQYFSGPKASVISWLENGFPPGTAADMYELMGDEC